MSKQVKASKTVQATLWQPMSDQQAEVVKGGFDLSLNGQAHWFCTQTQRLMPGR
ncbi:MAG: hypothetical protein AAF959_19015 [Cyanobacteria bacterium P01_D01_bin.56]